MTSSSSAAEATPELRLRYRVRRVVNLVNGSTPAGLAVARLGAARLARCPEGLLAGTGYQLPVPAAPAFTLGNVIITRRPSLAPDSALFRHEARHATQYAWCGGLLMLPLYFASAGASWLLSGDFGAWNPFERAAGLTDGGYTPRPLRHPIRRPTSRPGAPPPAPPLRRSASAGTPAKPLFLLLSVTVGASPTLGVHTGDIRRYVHPIFPTAAAFLLLFGSLLDDQRKAPESRRSI